LKQEALFLEITCLKIHPSELVIRDANNQILSNRFRRIVPNIYKYQKDEVLTLINDSPVSELDMSTSVVRWLIRELVKNTKFFLKSTYSTFRYEVKLEDISQLPITIQSKNGDPIWINRNTLIKGVVPSDLEGTLEESRLKNPFQFNALLRQANSSLADYAITAQENYSLEQIDPNDSRNRTFTLDVAELQNARVFHAKLVASSNVIIAMSNRRTVTIPRKPAYINLQDGQYQVFRLFRNPISVQKAIYVGTSTNWFHFIVELASRLVELPEVIRNQTPVVIESNAHRNIVRLCELMTGVTPIQLSIGDSVNVEKLFIVREFGVGDPIDSTQRKLTLMKFKEQIIGKIDLKDTKGYEKIYLRRPRNLYRPLQNENRVARILHDSGFVSIYPETYSLDDFIKVIRSAEYVVAESGAAITNLMFANPGTKFLEILPAIAIIDFWKEFVSLFGIEYSMIQGKTHRIGQKGYAYDGYKISEKNLIDKLSAW
jgi:capsular polysaccharide biosynthesis protein